jgi:hypothetical protein
MDHGWRAKEDGDRMKNAISQIYQADSTESHKRRIPTNWTGFVSRHNLISDPLRRGSITSRERIYNASASQAEAEAAAVPYLEPVFG